VVSGEPKEENVAPESAQDENGPDVLISFATALLDLDRLRIVVKLADGPANRMQLAEATGLSHRDLLRHLDSLQNFGLVHLQPPAPREPDPYSAYELNEESFRAARQAMGKYKGVRKRPSDSREMTLETFMPGGKLNAMPLKNTQIVVILDAVAARFEPEKQYTERDVNVILEEIYEQDYVTLRRYLVDYGYLDRSRDGSAYWKAS
jgi:DNA-binding HxlR family transcriptional regulator